jgi:hypothetical protein
MHRSQKRKVIENKVRRIRLRLVGYTLALELGA